MSNINFNLRGNLIPPELIQCEWNDFYPYYLNNFPESNTRKIILDNFVQFLTELNKLFPTPLEMWIDGSFVTKKTDPKDIDVVFFIDYGFIKNQQTELIKGFHALVNKYLTFVDAYLVVRFPINHPNYSIFQADYAEWYHLFSKTRPTRAGTRFAKGIIHLTYNIV